MDELKQVIIIRKDLEMGLGKAISQGAHASLMSYLETVKENEKVAKQWTEEGEKKIVLKVDDGVALEKLYNAFKYKKVPCALVSDAGWTQLPPGTKTALGIGPWKSSEIDPFTKMLKLL